MLNVLIPTKPDDTHAIFTQLALEKKGHKSLLWYTGDFPIQQTHSFELLHNAICWRAVGKNFEINDEVFDVVWYRRPKRPTLSTSVHPEDRINAQKESEMLFHTFWQVIAPDAVWINPANNAKKVNSKLLQLKVAAEIGLNIPHTIITNNPSQIRDFIAQYPPREVIYKTLFPMVWLKEKDMRLTYAKEINSEDLPSDEILQSTPGIFQKKISKAFELRITYFGEYPVTVKLRSQEHPKGLMDWRYVPIKELIVEEYALPDPINEKCKQFMKRFGLIFGCFDFIVTPDNEYFFLELNESGQFLWIEEINPNIKMLDIFSEFLINKSAKFIWDNKTNSVSLSTFQESAHLLLQKALALHINTDLF